MVNTDEIKLDRYFQHTIEVVIDRLVRKDGIEQRLTESLETALTLAEGVAFIDVIDGPTLTFSQHFACPECGLSFEELQPRNFSFNSPYGACTVCSGIGTRFQVDAELAIPQPDKSLAEGAIAPWAGKHRMGYMQKLLASVSAEHGIDMDAPFRELPQPQQDLLLNGTGERPYTVTYRNRFGSRRHYETTYEGVVPWLERRYRDTESEGVREQYIQFMREVPCNSCGGGRLNPVSLAVTVGGRSIFEVSTMSLRRAADWLKKKKRFT